MASSLAWKPKTQLDANLRLFVRPPLSAEDCARIEARVPALPDALLDPAQWPKVS